MAVNSYLRLARSQRAVKAEITFISFDAMPKDSMQGCWPLIGNLTRVADVEHKLYTSYPWSERYRAATHNRLFLLQFSSQISLQILKIAYDLHWEAATQPLLWMFFPLLKNVLSESCTHLFSHSQSRGKKPLNLTCLIQLGFTSLVMLRGWKKLYR